MLKSSVEISCWDYLLSLSVEIRCWDYLLSCLDYLLKSAVEIMCWYHSLRLSVEICCGIEITCCDYLLSLSVEISCWDYLPNCWNYLLNSSVKIICWNQLLRLPVEICCWDYLLACLRNQWKNHAHSIKNKRKPTKPHILAGALDTGGVCAATQAYYKRTVRTTYLIEGLIKHRVHYYELSTWNLKTPMYWIDQFFVFCQAWHAHSISCNPYYCQTFIA